MRKYSGVVVDTEGNAVSGAWIYVYPTGTTTVTTIYSDEGVTTKSNPTTSDTYGRFSFYVADGDYDLYVTGTSITSYTVSDVSIYDPFQKAGGIVNGSVYIKGTSPWLDAKAWGCKGDGTTLDTTVIQSMVAAIVSAGGGNIYFPPGTYLVSNPNSNTVTYNSATHYYCFALPSNSSVVLAEGATIKQASSTNSHIFVNSDITSGNSNIKVSGGIFDLNKANQTSPATGEQSACLFHKVTNLKIEDVKFTNVREYALRISGITKGRFVDLWCSDSDGSGFAFGLDLANYDMLDCFFDRILAESCAGGFIGASGNGFIFHGHNCQIGKIRQKACKMGLKIQDRSSEIQADELMSTGTTADHGVKLQGSANTPGNRIRNVTVNSIVTSTNYKAGAYLIYGEDLIVGKISSYGDGTQGADASVNINDGYRYSIGKINVINAGTVGVYTISSGAGALEHLNIGDITVINGSQVTATQNQVLLTGDYIHVGNILAIDDQTPVTNARGVYAQSVSGSRTIHIGKIRVIGTHATNQYDLGITAYADWIDGLGLC